MLAALTDPVEILPAEIPAGASRQQRPMRRLKTPRPQPSRIEIVGECLVAEPCIDQFLWALYQRTPKEDTIKESEQRKVRSSGRASW